VNSIYVNAHAKVIINDTVVHEFGKDTNMVSIETHNDSNHIGAYCDIVLPANVRLEYKNNPDQSATAQTPDPQIDYSKANKGYITAPTKYLFGTGDHIIIKAKYEGYETSKDSDPDGYLPVFDGFIYDFYESTPIKIKCLDYIYWFNIGIYGDKITTVIKNLKPGKKPPKKPKFITGQGVSFASTNFKTIILDLIDTVNYNIAIWNDENGTDYPNVELIEPMFDMPLVNIHFITMSPAAVLDWFKKEIGLAITLMGNKLYVNIGSNTTKTVTLQTDINVITANLQTTNLKNFKRKTKKGSIFLRLKLKCWFIRNNGTKDSFEIGDENGQLREVWFYNIKPSAKKGIDGTPDNYRQLAEEALTKFKFDRYTGEVETPLYPFADLFWKVQYFDIRYPERNGSYCVTLVRTILNESGFHRHLKLAYLDNQ
jgi:hypothetical protein